MPLSDAFDLAHLARQTAGDESLRREVLVLFDGQCGKMQAAIRAGLAQGDVRAVSDAAHTLKGAALGVGAQGVAEAALALETAPPERRKAAAALLEAAIAAAQKALRGGDGAC